MRAPYPILLAGLLAAGCGRPAPIENPMNPPEPNSPPQVQVPVGGPEPDDWGRLPFTIVAVHTGRTPADKFPFHAPGGDWTFLDCRANADPGVVFTVGVTGSGPADQPVAWGKALLAVPSREAGAKFVSLFGQAFHAPAPKPRPGGLPPEPLRLGTAVLGVNQRRAEGGGFHGTGDGWTATKWFPTADGHEAEVFFNYNLDARTGEFSEKDSGYRGGLVAVFAAQLRDGPRPERTPETDPNLAATGPRIEPVRRLTTGRAGHYQFAPDGRHAVYLEGGVVFAVPLPEGERVEIARFDRPPWELKVLDGSLRLLVVEGIAQQPGVRSSADPMQVWFVDPTRKEKVRLRGPEKDLSLSESPLSPGGRFVAMESWRDLPERKGRAKVLLLLDRTTGKFRTIERPGKSLTLTDWRGEGQTLRGVVVIDRWSDDKTKSEHFLIDPLAGTEEPPTAKSPSPTARWLTAPDGKHRAMIRDNELLLVEVASGQERRFRFHEDDTRFVHEEAVEWAGPRYVKFNGPRLALISAATLKMSYPTSAGDAKLYPSHGHSFSPDGGWVLYQGEDGSAGAGLHLGRVRTPEK